MPARPRHDAIAHAAVGHDGEAQIGRALRAPLDRAARIVARVDPAAEEARADPAPAAAAAGAIAERPLPSPVPIPPAPVPGPGNTAAPAAAALPWPAIGAVAIVGGGGRRISGGGTTTSVGVSLRLAGEAAPSASFGPRDRALLLGVGRRGNVGRRRLVERHRDQLLRLVERRLDRHAEPAQQGVADQRMDRGHGQRGLEAIARFGGKPVHRLSHKRKIGAAPAETGASLTAARRGSASAAPASLPSGPASG